MWKRLTNKCTLKSTLEWLLATSLKQLERFIGDKTGHWLRSDRLLKHMSQLSWAKKSMAKRKVEGKVFEHKSHLDFIGFFSDETHLI